jgi:hypothetical protein
MGNQIPTFRQSIFIMLKAGCVLGVQDNMLPRKTGSSYPLRQRHIVEERKPQLDLYENLKTRILRYVW